MLAHIWCLNSCLYWTKAGIDFFFFCLLIATLQNSLTHWRLHTAGLYNNDKCYWWLYESQGEFCIQIMSLIIEEPQGCLYPKRRQVWRTSFQKFPLPWCELCTDTHHEYTKATTRWCGMLGSSAEFECWGQLPAFKSRFHHLQAVCPGVRYLNFSNFGIFHL